MRLDELPQSNRIEDRRGGRIPGGRAGGIGIGTVVVLGLIGWALGIDPSVLIGGAEMMSRSGGHNKSRRPAQALRPTPWVGSFLGFLVARKRNGPIFSLKPGKSTNPQRWSCFPEQPDRVAGSHNRQWVRSIARLIRRFTSTQVSSRTSSDASALAMLAAKPANSPRPMWLRTRSGTMCRTC